MTRVYSHKLLMGLLFLLTLTAAPVFSVEAAGKGNFVGMQIQGMSKTLADALGLEAVIGVLVRDVALGGPADRAGFERGDLIVEFNNTKIEKFEQLTGAVKELTEGSKVNVKVLRGQKDVSLTLAPGSWPAAWKINKVAFSGIGGTGVTVSTLTNKVRKRFQLRWGATGVVVTLIDKERAPAMDLKRGDIITQVNQEPVWLPKRVEEIISEARKAKKEAVLLLVERMDGFRFVVFPLSKKMKTVNN
ncbi:MAG: PDZ domain-containing protein [Rhodospirillales bacterium]|nr:PDZ domain-containing protein [Rhodospirillales bacterium]